MENKTCNSDCSCKYKICDLANGCSYSGFCDFQAPRDSRKVDCIGIDYSFSCTCGQTTPCLQHPRR